MLRPPFSDVLQDAAWTVINTDNTVPTAKQFKLSSQVHRRLPIAAIMIQVVANTGSTGAAATLCADGIANILKSVQIYRNGVDAKTGTSRLQGRVQVMDWTGAQILEYAKNAFGLGRVTQSALTTAVANNSTHTLTYVIPFAHPQLSEPLHTHTLLPVHLDALNPEIVLNFAAQSEMDVNAAPTYKLKKLAFQVTILRAQLSSEDNAKILGLGGFIDRAFIQKDVQINAKQKWVLDIPSPGLYEAILAQTYRSDSARGDITDANNPVWNLNRGATQREILADMLVEENDLTLTANSVFTSGSYFLDFISSGLGNAENSLASAFDGNMETNGGVATNLTLFADPVGNGGSLATARVKLAGVAMLGDVSNRFNILA